MESHPRKRIAASTWVLVILCVMSFVMYIDRTNMATAALAVRQDLGLSNQQMGFVFSAFSVCYAVGMIPGSWVGDKLGPHRMLAICGVLWSLGTLLSGLATGLVTLILARFVVGLGESPIVPTSAKAMTVWMPADRRGFAQGITHSVARLGNAATPLIVAGLIHVSSWRVMFMVLGIASLSWVFLWSWYYRDDPREHPGTVPEEIAKMPQEVLRDQKPPMRWAPLLEALWPATAVSFCHGWALWFFLNWMPSYFEQNFHLDIKKSAIFSSSVFLAGVVGTTLGGTISDMVLRRTHNIRMARYGIIVFGFLAPIGFLVPLMQTPSLTVAAICLGAAMFLSELVTAPLWAVAMDLAPRHSATSSGVMNTGLAIAATISAPTVGWIVDNTHSWQAVFGLAIVMLLMGPILAWFIRPDRPYLGEDHVEPADGALAKQAAPAR